ncbi:hypothetical protein K435DRAFT_756217 [Dendrothele bispora CBS 962.96]|uniref:DUF92-domain-containing protein n=1 Tax=Dendrothele bispora (strain CBS 962.96) TaxID=1314807 RepID=A0A4S8LZU2_DENBC|nr:hypothetical protein K435DRAFT_756217 [Dendrothele bispora CBS 962.96]
MGADGSTVPYIPLLLATALSVHGLRRKSLSPNGAATAFVVGLCMVAGGTRVFGVSLIVFYLMGSRATKYGKQKKAQLEDGYHEAGYRTGWQVLSNSSSAFIACLAWNILFSDTSLQASLPRFFGFNLKSNLSSLLKINLPIPDYEDSQWCPLDASVAGGWSRVLVLATMGHFGCCLGDTLASELGILSKSRPILITTLKPVPPGTNGAMSSMGTMASIFGGAFMGGTVGLTLLVESARCREDSISILVSMLGLGAVAGGLGSLLDSFLGATVQQTRYSEDNKKILQDESQSKGPVKVISGWNLLTNNQVNVVSSVIISILMSLV